MLPKERKARWSEKKTAQSACSLSVDKMNDAARVVVSAMERAIESVTGGAGLTRRLSLAFDRRETDHNLHRFPRRHRDPKGSRKGRTILIDDLFEQARSFKCVGSLGRIVQDEKQFILLFVISTDHHFLRGPRRLLALQLVGAEADGFGMSYAPIEWHPGSQDACRPPDQENCSADHGKPRGLVMSVRIKQPCKHSVHLLPVEFSAESSLIEAHKREQLGESRAGLLAPMLNLVPERPPSCGRQISRSSLSDVLSFLV